MAGTTCARPDACKGFDGSRDERQAAGDVVSVTSIKEQGERVSTGTCVRVWESQQCAPRGGRCRGRIGCPPAPAHSLAACTPRPSGWGTQTGGDPCRRTGSTAAPRTPAGQMRIGNGVSASRVFSANLQIYVSGCISIGLHMPEQPSECGQMQLFNLATLHDSSSAAETCEGPSTAAP